MSTEYEPVIGLEIHCQLQTDSKIFSTESTEFGGEPNSQVNEYDLGLPGVLPVPNERAIEYAIRAGLALNCDIQNETEFARKNYFYPDLPKGYQISQHETPLLEGGHLDVETEDGIENRIGIDHIHLEEDAGKSTHVADKHKSLIDLNRTGVPLIEIVSEPDIRSAEQASAYFKKLRDIVVYLGISDGDMSEGSLRCDANVSVRPKGASEFGTRTELKNINSFKFVKDAIDYEINRHIERLQSGDSVVQQTRLYDPDAGQTVSMRKKEESHDYRYFSEPDVPTVEISEAWVDEIRRDLPELPEEKKERYTQQLSLDEYDADVIARDRQLAEYFESAVDAYPDNPEDIANWIINNLLAALNEDETLDSIEVEPGQLGDLISLIDTDTISGNIAQDVFEKMIETGEDPESIVEQEGLKQISDKGELEDIVKDIIEENPDNVEAYRDGKQQLIGWFIGQVMQATNGQANPQVAREVLQQKLQE